MNALADPTTRNTAEGGYRPLLQDSRFEVTPFDRDLVEAVVRRFESRADKSWSPTDCLSFGAMEERKLTAALTGGRYFQQAGFRAVPLEEPPNS